MHRNRLLLCCSLASALNPDLDQPHHTIKEATKIPAINLEWGVLRRQGLEAGVGSEMRSLDSTKNAEKCGKHAENAITAPLFQSAY